MNFEKKRGEESGNEAAIGCLKKVMTVVDGGAPAKQAMMWALTHVANKGDILTLLCVIPNADHRSPTSSSSSSTMREEKARLLVSSLASLCKACRPEVSVEALVIRGPKLATVLKQVKQLKISVLVLSQRKPSLLSCLMMSRNENFVEQCVEKAECLAMAVRKRSNGVGGYLVSTRCQRNFWLLA